MRTGTWSPGSDPRMVLGIFIQETSSCAIFCDNKHRQQGPKKNSKGPINMHYAYLTYLLGANAGLAAAAQKIWDEQIGNNGAWTSLTDAAMYGVINAGDYNQFTADVVGSALMDEMGIIQQYAREKGIPILNYQDASEKWNSEPNSYFFHLSALLGVGYNQNWEGIDAAREPLGALMAARGDAGTDALANRSRTPSREYRNYYTDTYCQAGNVLGDTPGLVLSGC